MPALRRTRALVAAVGLGCVLVLAVAGGAGAQDPTSTQPPTTDAPTTEAPTTEPPTTERPTTAPPATTAPETTTTAVEDEGDDSDIDWGLIAVIGGIALVVIAIIALIASAASRRSREQGTLNHRIARVVGASEWVHDQASLDLVAGAYTPDRLRAAWDDTHRRINDLGVEVNTIAADTHDERLRGELAHLAHSLALLGGALDTSVGLRLQPPSQDPRLAMATSESIEVVNQHRHELHAAIMPLAARV